MSDEYNSLIYNSKSNKNNTKSEGSNTWSNKNKESETKKNYKKKTLLSDRNRSRLEKRDKYNKYNTWSDKNNSKTNTTPDQTNTLIISIIRQKQHLNWSDK